MSEYIKVAVDAMGGDYAPPGTGKRSGRSTAGEA